MSETSHENDYQKLWQMYRDENERLREELQSFRRVLEDVTIERDRLREAHKRVIMHTARLPNTTDVELLNGLLDSCGRISLAALQEAGDETNNG